MVLREAFWSADPQSMDQTSREAHLWCVLLRSYEMTIRGLLEENAPISADTFHAKNDILLKTRR